ncbi:MAG: MATE family efflux transporter, partial [Verrucomicrobiota bacterium]
MSKPGVSVEATVRSRLRRGELGGRLAGLSLPRQILVLAIWPLFEQLLGFLVGLVDLILAGRFDPPEVRVPVLDAMGLAGYIGWLLLIVISAAGTGATALVSRATGAGDHLLARRALAQALILGLGVSVVAGAALYFSLDTLLAGFGLSGPAATFARDYLQIVAFLSPAAGIVLTVNACLRGSGDTRSPFFTMATVNVVNLLASWLFVFGPEPFGGHGVKGLALGTLTGWLCGG